MDLSVLNLLIRLLALLVGLVTLAIGFFFKKRLVILVGASLIGGLLIAFFVESEEMRDIMVSFAIIAAALLAALSIEETRHSSREKKMRDVIEWATDICDLVLTDSQYDASVLKGEMAYNFLWDRELELEAFRMLRARSVFVTKLAGRFPELKKAVQLLTDQIKTQIQFLFEFRKVKERSTIDIDKDAQEAHQNNVRIYQAAIAVVQKASDLI